MAAPLRVVVVGAGFGGLEVAAQLNDLALLGEVHVTVIEPRDAFAIGGFHQFVLDGRMRAEEVPVPYSRLRLKGVKIVKDSVSRVDAARCVVVTGSSGEVAYDECVIACGLDVRGLADDPVVYSMCSLADSERAHEQLQALDRGRVVISVIKPPYKCPPAPLEWAFVVDRVLRRRGVRDVVEIVFTSPEPQPMPVSGHVGQRIGSIMAEAGIQLRFNTGVQSVDAAARTVRLSTGDDLAYDMLITMPPNVPPAFLRESGLANEAGFIPADPFTLRVPSHAHLFALGDCAGITIPAGKPHPRAGLTAMVQAEAVAATLRALAADRACGPAKDTAQTGRFTCPVEGRDGVEMMVDVSALETPPVFKMTPLPDASNGTEKKRLLQGVLARWFETDSDA